MVNQTQLIMKAILTVIGLLLSISSFSQFRNTTWGMTPAEVKNIETAKLSGEYKGDLTYSVNISDLKCELKYVFANNKLNEIKYTFRTLVSEKSSQSGLWGKTVKNLVDKYGDPTIRDSEKVLIWTLSDFSITAVYQSSSSNEEVIVSYTPPSPSQKDIL